MDQDIIRYIKDQGVERLLFLIKDAENYDKGIGEAARDELISRGYTEQEIANFLNKESGSYREVEGGPLDAIWMKYNEVRSAKGLLLMAVLLLIVLVVKTLLTYAIAHYRFGMIFSFEISLFNIFLPMTLGAFSAYAIWKLLPIGWIAGHVFSYTIVFLGVYRLVDYFDHYFLEHYVMNEPMLDLNLVISQLLDLAIAIFVLIQINRKSAILQFRVSKQTILLTRYLMPVGVLVLFIAFKMGGVLG